MVERPTVKPQRLIEREETKADPWIGRQIAGRYRILSALGEGGMGRIFLAEHLTLGRKVALKVLVAEMAGNAAIEKRFDREAKTLSALHHPNIVAVNDYGVDGDTPFIVMELAPGQDLAQGLEANQPTPQQAYEVFRQLLRGVAHAHASGLVHRDLKPSNVMVRFLDDGSIHVQVLDFGLARFEEDDTRAGAQLTRAGTVLGTPGYMAPEQASGEGATPASDTYAAALILYEMLAGRRPFLERDPTALLRAHLIQTPPLLSEVAPTLAVPAELDAFLARGLAKSQRERFGTAGEMLAAFDRMPLASDRSSNPSAGMSQPPPRIDASLTTGKQVAQSLVAVSKRVPLPVWLAGAAGLVIAATGVTLLVAYSGDPPRAPLAAAPSAPSSATPSAPPSASASATQRAPSAPTMEAARPAAPAGPLPRELASVVPVLDRGRRLPRRVEGQLLRYARDHADDARPLLLLGRSYGNGRALSDALGAYENAWERSPEVRRDPAMQAHLLETATTNSDRLRSRARRLITQIYAQGEILPTLDRQLESARGDERTRLEQLRRSL